MSSVTWVPGLALPIGEDDVLDYEFGFSAWLAGDTIAAVEVIGTGLTAAERSHDTTTVEVRVSEAEANSKLVVKITTAGGQVASFATYFNPEPTTCAC